MKKLLFIVSVFLISLSAKAQTTQEEYNYVTKGLRTTLEQGLDIKKGYSLNLIQEFEFSGSQYNFYTFDRENGETACIIIIFNNGRNSYLLCIPHKETEQKIKQLCYIDLYALEKDDLVNILYFFSQASQGNE